MGKLTDKVAVVTGASKGIGARIDILVNNAGIYRFSPIEAVSEDDFHQHFNINVLGALLVTQETMAISTLMFG
jgi:3-oxoacyl-[acyl-carrier protein] reductase